MRRHSDRERTPPRYHPRVVIKLRPEIKLLYRNDLDDETIIQKFRPWRRLKRKFPGITFEKLYLSLDARDIEELVDRALELDSSYQPPNLLSYFALSCPLDFKDDDLEDLVEEVSSLREVELAYFEGEPSLPPIINPQDPHLLTRQGYLGPSGINATFLWQQTIAGSDGQGIRLIDIEQGWLLDSQMRVSHEDLTNANIQLLSGINFDFSGHGTSVLGVILSTTTNNLGNVGIAPRAQTHVLSLWRNKEKHSIADAIGVAATHLRCGDILLLEAQEADPPKKKTTYPVEILPGTFDAIDLATGAGIVVIEAAGNSGKNLDEYTPTEERRVPSRGTPQFDENGSLTTLKRNPNFRDSGAIMVAGSNARHPHTRLKDFSNYGTRIDCFAWGRDISTAGRTDWFSAVNDYRSDFGGTSGASAIIAGVALVVQGIAQNRLGRRFRAKELRAILSDPKNGTRSKNNDCDLIGVMPDLRKIYMNVFQGGSP